MKSASFPLLPKGRRACSNSALIFMNESPFLLRPICVSGTGFRSLGNQTQRDTPLFEELSGEVTITDPTHPLYGQTLPLLTVRINRSKTHVTVLLPTGRRRSVPRSATDLERPVEEVSHDLPLPVI